MKVLIVEDDRKIASFLQKGLNEEGYVTHWVADGEAGFQSASTEEWDVVIWIGCFPKPMD